jgi:8-oxo-dGTP pyrophosphatase MutT (NUDIX family)
MTEDPDANADRPAGRRCLRSRNVYHSRWMTVREDLTVGPHGENDAFAVVERAPFVAVIAVVDGSCLLTVRQFRYAVGRWLWELPQGGLAPGEDAVAAATRELREETGWLLHSARLLRAGLPEAGDWATHTFSVVVGTAVADHDRTDRREPSEASLSTRVVPLAELERMAASGTIVDPATLSGLYLWRLAGSSRRLVAAERSGPCGPW